MQKNTYNTMLDSEMAFFMSQESQRQQDHIELIASENFVSRDILMAQGSILTNKYAEGYPGKRYYGGCQFVDHIEQLAISRAKTLFGCSFANVQPHSGCQANQAVFLALLQPGDTILGMDMASGGHLTHGSKVSLSGKWFHAISYGVDPVTHLIDMDQVRTLALKHRPKLIIVGASSYSRTFDFKNFRAIADEIGAYVMADMAHVAGLIAANHHESPFPHAHVMTSTTHKTLRGPRGGLVLTNDTDLAKKIDSAVFPGLQGGPLMHVIAAKGICFAEAMTASFKEYILQVKRNAQALAQSFIQKGYSLLSGGTDNHLLVLHLGFDGITGHEAQKALEEIFITTNKNGVPNDSRSPVHTSGLRVGTAAVTTRGFQEEDMVQIAQWIERRLMDRTGPVESFKKEIKLLCEKYRLTDSMYEKI